MTTTSLSLLARLQCARPGSAEWRTLHDLYLPLLRSWLGRIPALRDECDDLAQEVLLIVFRELPSFERQRTGSFRAWLRQIMVNRLRAYWKNNRNRPAVGLKDADLILARLEAPNGDLSLQWDRDHDKHLADKLLALVQADFEPRTWQAFTRFALDGIRMAEVARELAISESAVMQAKFRVLKRLREEAGELLD